MMVPEDRGRAWRALFHGDPRGDHPTPLGRFVLDELQAYCFGRFSTESRDNGGRVDPVAMAINEGRRQVWITIQARLAAQGETVDDERIDDSTD